MRNLTHRIIAGLALAAGLQTGAYAQLGQRVSVVFSNTIDSTQPGSGQFAGQVKNAVMIGAVSVPAGSTAIAKLAPKTSGTTQSWSLSLVSIAAGGQNIAVNSISATPGMGAARASVSNSLQTVMGGGGLPWGKKNQQPQQTKQQSAPPLKPSTSGARVYLPSGSEVMFVLSQSATPQQTANATLPAAGAQPAATAAGGAAGPAIQQPGVGAASLDGKQVTPSNIGATSSSVVYENILYQLQGCQKQSPHIICTMQITNQRAVDAFLAGGQQSYYVDQSGNKVGVSNRRIANCLGYGNCQLLPGIAMASSFEFVDEEGRATTLARLLIVQSGKAVAQFTNVPVQ